MDNEKRVIIAFALSFVMLLIWRILFVTTPPPSQKSSATQSTPGQATEQERTAQSAAKPAAPKLPAPPQIPIAEGKQAQDIVVENSLYRITFSTRGGVITSWILKKYDDANGKPLDVVNPAACKQLGYPMSVRTANESLNEKANQAIYVAQPSASTLKAPATLELTYSNGHVQIQKKFTFGSDYIVKVNVSVAQDQQYVPVRVAWVGGFGDHSLSPSVEFSQSKVAYETDDNLETTDLHKIENELTKPGPFEFAG
ncbi:MAG: membrane protein insertase YidC, partial [Acidobacteria bacterium]|nr:membrane protein insertase YidC [Acidobacteriota bacterium]